MKYSRRNFALLLPALVTAGASAQGTAQNSAPAAADTSVEKLPVIKTKAYLFNDLAVTTNGQNRQRRMFTAKTHTGFKIE